MKTFLLTFLLSALGLAAQDRCVTITLPERHTSPDRYGTTYQVASTNSFEITSGETAHLISMIRSATNGGELKIYVQKDGVVGLVKPSVRNNEIYITPDTLVVNGPAKLLVVGTGGNMATFKITPDQYPPDRTVVVPGGPGGATVTMECSTNLVQWESAVGGTYTNLPGVKFFRIKLDRIQP